MEAEAIAIVVKHPLFVGVSLALAIALGWGGIQSVRLNHAKSDLAAALSTVQQYKDAEKAAQSHAKTVDTASATETKLASTDAAKAVERVRTVFQTITKEVPVYVTVQTDQRFPLPVGFVRVHDAAAAGLDVSQVPDAAGKLDDAPSGVPASDAAAIIASNYGSCTADRARLVGLQDWVKAEQAIFAK